MKRAIIIMYEGGEPAPHVLATLIASLCEYGVIHDPDHKPDAFVMDEKDIAQALVHKGLASSVDGASHDVNKYEEALAVICEPFMNRIKEGDLETFAIELTNAMQYNMANGDSPKFTNAVKIIAEEGSEVNLSPSFLFNHGLSNKIVQIIRRTRDVVCQGRHIIIQ